MLWRMLRQSWGRNLRRKVLAIITVFSGLQPDLGAAGGVH